MARIPRLLCAFALVAGASLGVASAQSKVGVINTQKALLETAEIKKAQAELETKYKPRQDRLLALQKELQDLQAQLNSGRVTEANAQDLQAQGQRKQREAQRISEDLQADLERERTDILARSGTRMQEVVKQIADAKGLDVVVDAANTVFYKQALDITAEVTAAYDKAHPVK